MKTAKFICVVLCAFGILFYSMPSMTAEQVRDKVEVKFIHALMKQNEELAQSYLAKGVTLPKQKLQGGQILPTSKQDVVVLVGHIHHEGELGGEVISLIWELTVKKDIITNINVIY